MLSGEGSAVLAYVRGRSRMFQQVGYVTGDGFGGVDLEMAAVVAVRQIGADIGAGQDHGPRAGEKEWQLGGEAVVVEGVWSARLYQYIGHAQKCGQFRRRRVGKVHDIALPQRGNFCIGEDVVAAGTANEPYRVSPGLDERQGVVQEAMVAALA